MHILARKNIMATKSPLNTLGATNHSKKERSALDYYGTNPEAVKELLKREAFSHKIWEPTSGHGNIVNALKEAGYEVLATDIFDYGRQDGLIDFLEHEPTEEDKGMDIVMNPPYYDAEPFVVKALECVSEGRKVAAFLRLLFLEGQSRYKNIFKDNPPKTIYVFSKRQVCSKTDDFTEGSAVAYCWMVWEKGSKADPVVRWIA